MRLLILGCTLLALSACATAKHVRCVAPTGEVMFEADNVEVLREEGSISVRKKDGHWITIYGACKVEY